MRDVALMALGAYAWGSLKSKLISSRVYIPKPTAHQIMDSVVVGPVTEEAIYRLGFSKAGIDHLLSSAIFGASHYVPNHVIPGWALAADAFVGGLIYYEAFRRDGVFGSSVVHAAHNLGAMLGGI